MGFIRMRQPERPIVVTIDDDIDRLYRNLVADAAKLADGTCPKNPTGKHLGIGSCGEVVCVYCDRVFWR
jgi:hypothetical protein